MLIADKVTKIYGDINSDSSVLALDNVSLSINDGEFVCIMGQSGSGKSTLLNLLGALDLPTYGEILLNDQCVSKMSDNERAELRLKSYGFVFQNFFLEPRFTVLKNTVMPLVISGIDKVERETRAREILSELGLTDKINKKAGELSGGQMQRVAIARALIHKPSVVFADEPTGNLDSRNGADIINLFHKIKEQGASIVMVTHNSAHLDSCDRVIRIEDGKIYEA